MILNLTRRWGGTFYLCRRRWGGTFYLYRATVCHGNTDVIGEGSTAEDAIKNMSEGIRDDWAEATPGREKP